MSSNAFAWTNCATSFFEENLVGRWKLSEWKLSEWKKSDYIFILVSKNRDNIKTTQYAKLKHHPHDEKEWYITSSKAIK